MEEFASLILGTYIITLFLTHSEGPWGALYKLRNNKAVDNFGVLNCFMCTAFWVALGLCLILGRMDLLFISWGAATALDRLIK